MNTMSKYGVVYLLVNSTNGKVYVGQTKNTVPERWRQHISASRRGYGSLSRAIRKYGQFSFGWAVLCEEQTFENLNKAESAWIKRFNSTDRNIGYNLRSSVSGPATFSLESRKKMSAAKKGRPVGDEVKALLLNYSIGRVHSVEEREKVSRNHKQKGVRPPMVAYQRSAEARRTPEMREAAAAAQRGKTLSLETREKLSAAMRGRTLSAEHRANLCKSAIEREKKKREYRPEAKVMTTNLLSSKRHWTGVGEGTRPCLD